MPVNLLIGGQSALVVGGGKSAYPEVTRLIEFGAKVTVVAPHIMTEIDDLAKAYFGKLSIEKRRLAQEDLDSIASGKYRLVFALSSESSENEKAFEAACSAGALISTAEPGLKSNLLLPTTLKRGHLKVSVSADGISPALERAMLERIEGSLTQDIDNYVIFLAQLRETLTWLMNDSRLSAGTLKQIETELARSEELYRAISRRNFDESRKLVDHIIRNHSDEASEATTV